MKEAVIEWEDFDKQRQSVWIGRGSVTALVEDVL